MDSNVVFNIETITKLPINKSSKLHCVRHRYSDIVFRKGKISSNGTEQNVNFVNGGLAEMVELALRMRKVAGSIPASSKLYSLLLPMTSKTMTSCVLLRLGCRTIFTIM